ncbi:hypothetical protein GUJ93_ZPchr0007g5076 [Zizania palustris]|uniref:Longin domain-containing protein n=1 Tax=Zizania palustris TaxID=103762 RepID=A0A8J5SR99_ZIZPA|nr:hypothetical protein GUJ93_ZPchr0007g5076 [Zizania palustris]
MKITALLVLKPLSSGAGGSSSSAAPGGGSGSEAAVLANATDVSHFGFFQRSAAREFIVFVARTVAQRTQPGQRQSVQHEEYKVHSHNRNGLCVVAFMDDHYPVRSAFSLLNKVLDEYQKSFGDSWKAATKDSTDSTQQWPFLTDALTKFQVLLSMNKKYYELSVVCWFIDQTSEVIEMFYVYCYRLMSWGAGAILSSRPLWTTETLQK